jgi:hypothetical protein
MVSDFNSLLIFKLPIFDSLLMNNTVLYDIVYVTNPFLDILLLHYELVMIPVIHNFFLLLIQLIFLLIFFMKK